jgi:bacterioferritin (cytochrome b1)
MRQQERENIVEKLNAILSKEYNSMVQYVWDANPYVSPDEQPALEVLHTIIEDERCHAKELGRLITFLEGIPNPGRFDYGIADINYLALDYLMGLIVKDKENIIGLYDEALTAAHSFPSIYTQLVQMQEEEQQHLMALKAIYETLQMMRRRSTT